MISARRLRLAAASAALPLALGACGSFWPWSEPPKPPMPEPPAVTAPVPARVAWTARSGPAGIGFSPVFAAGSVFAAAADGTVSRIDPATGRNVWQVSIGKPLSSGVGSDGEIVVVALADGTLVALDGSGKRKWTAALGGKAVTVPAVGLGLVVVRSSDNRIQAFEADTGERRWSSRRQNPPLVLRQTGAVAIAAATSYVGLPGGKLVALSLQNGAQRWEASVGQPSGATEIERIADVVGTPLVSGRDVCAANYNGRLACFDATTGRMLWSRDVKGARGFDLDARLVGIVDERDHVHAFSRTGSSVWRQDKFGGRVLSAPASLGPVLVAGDSRGLVHLLSRDDGAVAGRFTTDGSPIVSAPVAAGRLAIVQTSAGSLVAIELE